jgi:PAS domain S-box-containing protein
MNTDIQNIEYSDNGLAKFERGQLRLLSDLAISFTYSGIFSEQVAMALKKIGSHLQVSRVYIFEDTQDGKATCNTFEWCNDGIAPQIDDLQGIPYEVIPSWPKLLDREGRIYTRDIQQLPDDLIAILEPQGILSLLVYPLVINGHRFGFMGFDECQMEREWKLFELEFLRTITGIVSTVFERHQKDDQIKVGEKNFRSLFETIGDLIFVEDLNGSILYTNPAVSEKLGYSQEQILNMHILDFHPVLFQEEAAEILADMLDGKRDYYSIPLQTIDGYNFTVETRIWNGIWNGKPCIYRISKDLSAQKKALDMFNKLFRYNPTPMALSDSRDFTFIEVNEAYEKTHGYNRDEVIGRTSKELGYFNDPLKQRQVMQQLLEKGEIRNIELQVRKKDGTLFDGMFSGVKINFQNSSNYLTVMVDITEQNRMKREIEEQRDRLEYIIQSAQIGTWEWRVQTGEVIFNDQWANMMGYTLEELQPLSIAVWSDLVHPDDLAESYALLQRHFSKELPRYECEIRMLHKGEYWIWIQDQGKVVEWDENQLPIRMFGTHTNITQRKDEEQELQESIERTVQGVQAKSMFLAKVGHDIRTPLNIINGLNHLLQETQLTDRQKDYIVKIGHASDGLLFSINNLLDFTKIESGKAGSETYQFSLKKLLNDLEIIFAYPAECKGIDFLIEVQENVPAMLNGDGISLRHILQNLLDNALKFTEKGEVVLTVSAAIISEAGVKLKFSVRDTGFGIESDIIDNIFEPFSLSSKGQNSEFKGTGLGLSICKDLSEKMNGTLKVTSIPGKGSEFVADFMFTNVKADTAATDNSAWWTAKTRKSGGGGGLKRTHSKDLIPDVHLAKKLLSQLNQGAVLADSLICRDVLDRLIDNSEAAVSIPEKELFILREKILAYKYHDAQKVINNILSALECFNQAEDGKTCD